MEEKKLKYSANPNSYDSFYAQKVAKIRLRGATGRRTWKFCLPLQKHCYKSVICGSRPHLSLYSWKKIVWGAAGMSEVTPKWSKLVRSSLIYFFFKLVIFVRLVSWFLGVSYQGDYFYQLVYTFLMIMQLSQAENSSF